MHSANPVSTTKYWVPPVVLALLSFTSSAQESNEIPEFVLEEITVTAEREEASILEVPISVTSFDEATLDKYQITNLKDLEVRVPGLQFGLDSPATIRGIGSLYRGVGGDVAVAQYSNDVYFDEPYGVLSSMYDLERIEVLRGPQGTLYGRNSIAGAINYVNKRPQFDEFGAGTLVEAGAFNSYRLNGHINVPLDESIAFRLTGEWQQADGNQENISGPDQGGRGDTHIAPQVRFVFDDFEFNIRYAKFTQDSASELRVPVRYPNTGREFHANPIDGSPSEERNQFFRYPNTEPPSISGGDLQNRIDMNNGGTTEVDRSTLSIHGIQTVSPSVTMKWIYGQSDVSIGLLDQDCDGSSVVGSETNEFLSNTAMRPFSDCTIRALFDVTSSNNELQILYDKDQFSGLAGLYILFQTIENEYNLYNVANRAAGVSSSDAVPIEGIFGTNVFFLDPDDESRFITNHISDGSNQIIDVISNRAVDAYAAYAQGSMQFAELWQATVGVRATRDEKEVLTDRAWFVIDLEEENPLDSFVIPARFNSLGELREEDFDKVTGNVSLEYTPEEDRLIYGRIATGYRSGGIQPGAPAEFATYEDEDLMSFEVGYKANLYDDRIRMLVSGFLYNFSNYQQPVELRLVGPNNEPYSLGVVTNLPDTRLNGIEIESTLIISPYFSIEGYYAFQSSSLGELYATDSVNPDQEFEEITFTSAAGFERTTFLGRETNLEGNELPNMPNHKWSISANGLYRLDRGGSFAYNLSYSYTGERFNRIFNIPNDVLEGYSRVDASVSWSSADRKHQVTAFVENITDTIGILELESNGWDAGYYQDATLSDPRFFGVNYRWLY